VHCNTCEGASAALRSYLRALRGVHKQHLHLYVATYETMVNTKRITPEVIRRMCLGDLSGHTKSVHMSQKFKLGHYLLAVQSLPCWHIGHQRPREPRADAQCTPQHLVCDRPLGTGTESCRPIVRVPGQAALQPGEVSWMSAWIR
jgi:hypothetical protein